MKQFNLLNLNLISCGNEYYVSSTNRISSFASYRIIMLLFKVIRSYGSTTITLLCRSINIMVLYGSLIITLLGGSTTITLI